MRLQEGITNRSNIFSVLRLEVLCNLGVVRRRHVEKCYLLGNRVPSSR